MSDKEVSIPEVIIASCVSSLVSAFLVAMLMNKPQEKLPEPRPIYCTNVVYLSRIVYVTNTIYQPQPERFNPGFEWNTNVFGTNAFGTNFLFRGYVENPASRHSK